MLLLRSFIISFFLVNSLFATAYIDNKNVIEKNDIDYIHQEVAAIKDEVRRIENALESSVYTGEYDSLFGVYKGVYEYFERRIYLFDSLSLGLDLEKVLKDLNECTHYSGYKFGKLKNKD